MVTIVLPDQESALGQFVDALVEKRRLLSASKLPLRVAWLNHYSIRLAVEDAPEALTEMDVCGVDGQLLKWLLRHPVRTSADLVVPVLLRCDQDIRTVLAIGGVGDRAVALAEAFSDLAGRPVAVHCMDGFDGLLRGDRLRRVVAEVEPDLVLVGLGAGLQEQVLMEASEAMAGGYALTCGGFLDQVVQTGYYPSWAYPLRLNWLVRLAREPRRLWRRYTVQAFTALLSARAWRRFMIGVPGLVVHAQMGALDRAAPGRPLTYAPKRVPEGI